MTDILLSLIGLVEKLFCYSDTKISHTFHFLQVEQQSNHYSTWSSCRGFQGHTIAFKSGLNLL